MELIEVGGHTIDKSILSDGCIIDVGCRGFIFSDYFTENQVYCIDPDPDVFYDKNPLSNSFIYMNVAISDKVGDSQYYENGEATCLKQLHHYQDHRIKPCKTITMDDLYKITGENVDILKLDCEGAEYIILGETFKPIPKQISVEMHRHCVPEMHDREYPKIVERPSRDYVVANDPAYERRHGCPENWWDVLWIRKDIFNGNI